MLFRQWQKEGKVTLADSRFSHYYHNAYTCGGPSPSVFSETNNESTAAGVFPGYMTHRSGHTSNWPIEIICIKANTL